VTDLPVGETVERIEPVGEPPDELEGFVSLVAPRRQEGGR
jgi:hypothetical protein